MATAESENMGLDPDDLNAVDEWILDFLGAHEWASVNLMRAFYREDVGEISRQWIANRVTRLEEHEHVERVHPDAYERQLVSDPRDDGTSA